MPECFLLPFLTLGPWESPVLKRGYWEQDPLWPVALCPCSQHNAAVPAEPPLCWGLEPSGLLCFLHVQLLQAGCRAQGLPPATAPPHQSAPDRVPWMHLVLEQVKSKLGVPSKARHSPSFAVCPVVP